MTCKCIGANDGQHDTDDCPAAIRAQLEKDVGQVWDTDELCRDFEVEGFGAPFVVVTRKADNVRGSLEFTHMPRFYFSFAVDK